MISRLRIRGLGPHVDTTLDLDAVGVTTIEGRSESGKSTIMDAVAFVLWGQDRTGRPLHPSQIRGDGSARVELTLRTGATLTRELRLDDKGQRVTVRTKRGADGEAEYDTDKAWLGAIGALGARAEVVRHVLVPMAWRELALGEGGGRPLRDLLNRIVPEVPLADVVAQLMDGDLRRSDPLHEGDARDLRTRAGRERDRAQGAVDHARLTLAAAEAHPVEEPADLEERRQEAERARAWLDYHWALLSHGAALKERERAAESAAAWDERLAALGLEPEADAGLAEAGVKFAAADQAWADACARHAAMEREVAVLETTLAGLPKQPDRHFAARVKAAEQAVVDHQARAGDASCPTCGQHDPKHKDRHVAELKRLRAVVADAQAELDAERARLVAARAEAEEQLQGAREAAAVANEVATGVEREREAAEQALTVARSGAAPRVAWQQARRALGERPPVPAHGSDAPVPPDAPRPEGDLQAILAAWDATKQAAARAQQRAEDVERGRGTLRSLEDALEVAVAEHQRLERLVAAVRRAPSVQLEQGLHVLGDLGPVSIRHGDKGGVEVLVDGRPWHVASSGRQIVADAWLRAGFRRAAKLGWVPLVVDQRQDVGGQPLHAPAPAIVLVTTEAPVVQVQEVP